MDTIISRIAAWQLTDPDGTAVVADGARLTYAQLWKQANGFAAYLASCEVRSGDRVLIKAFPTADFVIAVIGCAVLGAVSIPVEKMAGHDAVCDIAGKTGASHYVGNTAIPGCGFTELSTATHLAGQFPDTNQFCELPGESALAVILFTTGTTGISKGVMLSHKALFAACDNNACADELNFDSRYLIAAPLNHASGFRKLLSCLLSGATAVLLDGFLDVMRFYRTLKAENINTLVLPPSALRILLNTSASELAKYSSQIKVVHIGAAVLPEANKERLSKLLPESRLLFGYGSTEAGNSTVYDFSQFPGRENCVGKPNPHTGIFIADEEGNPVTACGEQGRLAISGDTLMDGYYKDEKLTAQVMHDGVLYTNDIGYIDREGFVYVLGRTGDVINSGGLKISPAEVENTVMRYKGISDCACMGIPDKISGEAVKLYIVCEEEPDMIAFRKFLLDHLEYYKVPTEIEKRKSLPRLPNGKLDRRKL